MIEKILDWLSDIFHTKSYEEPIQRLFGNVYIRSAYQPKTLIGDESLKYMQKYISGYVKTEDGRGYILLKRKGQFFIVKGQDFYPITFKKGLRNFFVQSERRPLRIEHLIIDYEKIEDFKDYLKGE